ncbi:MAG: hypothetical protein K2H22_05790 [Muribaculaceae bacterium]|nr:hypothetical protein [Muribaculaceae bacterium]
MRRILLLFALGTLLGGSVWATDPKESLEEYAARKTKEFEKYSARKRTEFEQYRQRLNEQFTAKLSGEWKQYRTEPKKQLPSKPKPPKPTVVDNTKPVTPTKVPVKSVVPPEKKIPDIPVTIPKIDRRKPTTQYPVNFNFYNTPCGIGRFDTSSLALSSTDNSGVSKAWKGITANSNLEPILADCLRLREEMRLCDWGFLQLCDKVGAILFPNSPDKQAFLATAIMIQAGYDCRLMKKNGRIALAYHPSHTVYGQSCYSVDKKQYYIFGPLANQDGDSYTYPGDFHASPTPIRMVVERYPQFAGNPSTKKYSSASWTSAPPFEVDINKSVMDFFDSYPIVDWNLYGLAPVSPEVEHTLFPVMDIVTKGLGEEEAVNMILSYMNYGFKYMTDPDQFGREKPFFPDENFYYPYNDCEDRAILFSKIVKNVLGLDTVYLFYPGHLAAAVRFSPEVNVKGSTVDVDGVPYVVCDPTCIGGKAGYLHPSYKDQLVKIYKVAL